MHKSMITPCMFLSLSYCVAMGMNEDQRCQVNCLAQKVKKLGIVNTDDQAISNWIYSRLLAPVPNHSIAAASPEFRQIAKDYNRIIKNK